MTFGKSAGQPIRIKKQAIEAVKWKRLPQTAAFSVYENE